MCHHKKFQIRLIFKLYGFNFFIRSGASRGKSIQDFGERYFAGEFEFEIDVSNCTKEETGMIIEIYKNLAVVTMQGTPSYRFRT
ncbi:MAG: hypothetical protein ACW98G_17540 [Candidatus Hodarchaeales archaeon]|jgi:hypothetical protein